MARCELPVRATKLASCHWDIFSPLTVAILGDISGNNLINGLAGDDNLSGGLGTDTLNGGDGADTLNGGAGVDILNGGNGNDIMLGGGGVDTLTGGAGVDTMSGNGGSDIFIFGDITDGTILHTGVGAARDIITDFTTGADDINLAFIDANSLVAGNQAFTLTAGGGAGAFTGAGQLRGFIEPVTLHLILEGDINGDGVADFQIQLNNPANFIPATDLIP